MSGFDSLDDLLRRIEPRMRRSATRGDDPLHDLLEQSVEELKVAVEELRVMHEQILAGAERDALRAAERAFRDAFTAAPLALLLTDSAGVVEFANAAAGALLGIRPTDAAGKPLAGFVGDDASRAFRAVLNDMASHAAPRAMELTLAPRARLPVQVEASVWPVFGEAGLKLAWSLADVTTRRATEQGVAEQGGLLRAAFDSLPLAVAAMDRDGSVLLWNRAAGELLGWSEDELAGRPNPAVPDESALDAVRRRSAWPSQTVASAAECRDGTSLAVELELAPLVDADGRERGSLSLIRAAEPGADAPLHWPESEMRRVLLEGVTAGTLGDRLREGITAGLHAGHLRPGDRLPSIRDAAQETGIDHRAVSAAYRRLGALGLVEVKPRKGVRVATPLPLPAEELAETAEWLSGVLEDASRLQVRVGSLADLVRRWTGAVTLRCACVDATEDGRAALCHEMQHQWGMEAVPVDPRGDAEGRRELAAEIRRADLVVTTHYHAHALAAACAPQRKPLVLARLNGAVVESVEAWLERARLTAVVVDRAYGERLRALRGGQRVAVVAAGDRAAVEALDADTPVLATLAAQQAAGRPLRLLVPTTHFVSPVLPRAVARLLVRANMVPRAASA